jgi:7-cyano-7-deazaguanine synthase
LSAPLPASALVLFSGGQDSTTCLAYALEHYARVETVGFDYRQRHHIELVQRMVVLERLRAEFPLWSQHLFDDHMIDAGVLATLGSSALTEQRAIEMQDNGLPNTFVPGRNLLFLVLAAARPISRVIRIAAMMPSRPCRWRSISAWRKNSCSRRP